MYHEPCISSCSPCLGGVPKENTSFFDMVQEMGKESMSSNSQLTVQTFAFSFFLISAEFSQPRPTPQLSSISCVLWFSVQMFTKQVHVEVCPFVLRGLPGCCLLLPLLPLRKTDVIFWRENSRFLFATEDFLCAHPLPVQWQQGVALHGRSSAESFQSNPCTEGEEIPSYWCLWSQIKVNLPSRKHDRKCYLTSPFTFSSLPWSDSLYFPGYRFLLQLFGAALFHLMHQLKPGPPKYSMSW